MQIVKTMEKEKEFAKIVTDNKSTIYSICYMYAKDKSEIDDYYQEILINLLLGYAKFRGESSISTWIWRVSINTCISFIRKDKRKLDTIPLSVNINQIESDDHEGKQVAKLNQRINKLDKLEKAMVLLWLENMSYDDIASVMGMTVPSVSTRLVRIKDKLKQMSND